MSEQQWVGSDAAKRAMGDDGTGHCRGCGNPLDSINVDCHVCVAALNYLNGIATVAAVRG